MKIINIVKNLLIGLLGALFFVFAITMTILLLNYNNYGVSQFGDTSLIIIRDKVSSEIYSKGDLLFVESMDIKNIKVGDEIFAYKINSDNEINIDFGVVGEIHNEDDAISFENGSTYAMKFIIGKSTKVYNKVGAYLSIVESKWGFLFMVLLPSFLIFVYEFYSLIMEIKYGRKED